MSRTIDKGANQLGFTTNKLLSNGAGHDAQEIVELCPMGMIFISSREGISHSPRKFSPAQGYYQWGANILLPRAAKACSVNLNHCSRCSFSVLFKAQ